ncbi:hypothetical protein [Streptomyces hawaiiensis]|uniref:hypothetical protein n=1 Tax=Streptomyces hawaiiensis TaxID=67305 RepID=UPI0036688FFD
MPADFTASATAPAGTLARPTLTVLTNQSARSVGSGLARTVTPQAAENASLQVGKELTTQMGTAQAKLPAAARVLLADPAAVTVQDGHPLDSHSGLGLTAFYALTLVVVGMLSANVMSGRVDHALGFAEFEPLRQLTGGVRSILYCDAQGDAGLTRGWAMMAAGLVMAALFGFGVRGWYDREGLHRIPVETTPEKAAVPA